MVVGGGGVESDYSVCLCPLLQFLLFLQLRQFTLEGRDVCLSTSITLVTSVSSVFSVYVRQVTTETSQ